MRGLPIKPGGAAERRAAVASRSQAVSALFEFTPGVQANRPGSGPGKRTGMPLKWRNQMNWSARMVFFDLL